jgi:hypothetical protein
LVRLATETVYLAVQYDACVHSISIEMVSARRDSSHGAGTGGAASRARDDVSSTEEVCCLRCDREQIAVAGAVILVS